MLSSKSLMVSCPTMRYHGQGVVGNVEEGQRGGSGRGHKAVVIHQVFEKTSTLTWQPASWLVWYCRRILQTRENSESQELLCDVWWCNTNQWEYGPLRERGRLIPQSGAIRTMEEWRLVQPFWLQLAGYPNLRFQLGYMIGALLVPWESQVDLALFLVLHVAFFKKNELQGEYFQLHVINVYHSTTYAPVKNLGSQVLDHIMYQL